MEHTVTTISHVSTSELAKLQTDEEIFGKKIVKMLQNFVCSKFLKIR